MKSLRLPTVVLAAFATLLPVVANGQTAAPRAAQAAPAPRAPAAAPAKAPAATAAPAPPAAPAAPAAASKSSAQKTRIPANLFKLPDGEIIFVGGKQMTAAALRQDIRAQVLAAAAPPTLTRVASRKSPGQSKLPISADAAALLARSHGPDKAPAVIDCTQQGPTILAVQGAVASAQQFTLLGTCFGEQSGDVKLIGQFPGGNLHGSTDPVHPGIAFTQWSAGRIVAVIPSLTGVTDQTVAISVTTRAGNRESPAKQATFTATRQRVEVPSRFISPVSHYDFTWYTFEPAPKDPMQFEVTINPACSLDNLDVHATVGRINSVTGWTDGPPNSSTVQIGWSAPTTTTTYWTGAVDTVTSLVFDVRAWADCPIGVAP